MAEGLDTVAAQAAAAAANNDALMPMVDPFSFPEPFFSMEHITFPFFAIAGNPMATGDATLADGLSAGVIDEVKVVVDMVAIFLSVGRKREQIRS